MVKINILTSDVYNRISAGEVVERPKSVVKELVENSIDAGASIINIEIDDGGITSIKITDNGCGIDKEYVKTAFMPHATSKVCLYEDLNSMSTLGFRGEALASIASVSNVELSTKSADDKIGTFLELRGGEQIKYENIDRNIGTCIIIRNIFFNTPARQKFLKKPKSEESDITSVITGLILANPDISFKYFADSKLIYSSNGKGLESAVYSIYPTSITKGLFYFEHNAHNINISGYISTPELTKSNRNFQTAIINGRLIENVTISTAASRAYGNRLMKRNFPLFILDIIMPFDSLDVNVTPSKTDVRFFDNNAVFSSIYRGVELALSRCSKVFSISDDKLELTNPIDCITSNIENTNTLPNSIKTDTIADMNKDYSKNTSNVELSTNIMSNSNNNKHNNEFNNISNFNNNQHNMNENNENIAININKLNTENTTISSKINDIMNIKADNFSTRKSINNNMLKVTDNNIGSSNKINTDNIQSTLFDDVEINLSTEKYKVLGQIFNTYLLVEKELGIYLIDQHAAHERLIYDKIISKISARAIGSQQVFAPQIIHLTAVEQDYILNIALDLEKIGLTIEGHGVDSISIKSLPTILPNFNAENFIKYLIADTSSINKINLKDLLEESIAMAACKAAIKAGQMLNEIQINEFIKQIEEHNPCQCPHGRPTIIKITRKDIDKLFKRIL